ncbi:Hint domain-containing protein, partial [Paracoccaceae bacterium]|nr:Hint domain-containing protein [Paracoccaceae bacterium]
SPEVPGKSTSPSYENIYVPHPQKYKADVYERDSNISEAMKTPSIQALSNGNFVVTFSADKIPSPDGSGLLFGRRTVAYIYNKDFNIISDMIFLDRDTRLNYPVDGIKGFPSISALKDGGFVVTWEDPKGDLGNEGSKTGNYEIEAAIYDAQGKIVKITGQDGTVQGTAAGDHMGVGHKDDQGDAITEGDDSISGASGDDTISASGGNDTIDGGTGNDSLTGGTGDDSLAGGSGDDTYVVDSSTDDKVTDSSGTDEIQSSVQYTLLDASGVENLTLTGTNNSWGTGNVKANVITGNDGNNMLKGLKGKDTLAGGKGEDSLKGGDGTDSLVGGAGNDLMSGGNGMDSFAEVAGDGSDTISDFMEANADGKYGDFIDLSAFYNKDTLAAVNKAGGTFSDARAMMQKDQEDGHLDGVIDGNNYSDQIGEVDLYLNSGVDAQGNAVAVKGDDLTYKNTAVVCFAKGTLLRTVTGDKPIEQVTSGDLVWTQDAGYQPVRWIGSRYLSTQDLEDHPKLTPIRIRAGALGCGLPKRDLVVSPQHRMLVQSQLSDSSAQETEILIGAKFLTQIEGIEVEPNGRDVTYFHMLFDCHQVVEAEGALSESLFTGQEALK